MKQLIKITAIGAMLTIIFGASAVSATSFTQGYISNGSINLGTVVSIAKDGSNQIEPTTTTTDSRIVGVAANANSSIIDLQPKGSNIRVAVSGDAQILVATSGGDIKKGDNLVISPLAGIAEHDSADSTANKYIGVAQASFSASTAGAQQVSVQLSDGKSKTVSVGLISANVLISDRQPGQNQQANSLLSKIGEHITGRQVSSLRVVASAVVLISVFSITGWILNASIRGSFVSLGRNPLARISILTNLMRVIIIALVIFAAGLTASYLVLAL